jgi:hypothetical protein
MQIDITCTHECQVTVSHRQPSQLEQAEGYLSSFPMHFSCLLFGILLYFILYGNVLYQLCLQLPILDKLPDTGKVIEKAAQSNAMNNHAFTGRCHML